jgi:cation diffusion facilitator CzcD-associated flavoprotein CzcO
MTGDPGGAWFEFISPIYDDLDTNIPHSIMEYSNQRFPDGTPLFPRHEVVLGYLERYADEVRHLVRFGTEVVNVSPAIEASSEKEKWVVRTRNIKTREERVQIFDAVIVANGHYETPFVPDIPGITEWNTAYPGSISHSKFYRRPDEFRDKVRLNISPSTSNTKTADLSCRKSS